MSLSRSTTLSLSSHAQASSWSVREPVLVRLQTFLPQPFMDSELKALDPREHQQAHGEDITTQQGLPYLIYEELCLHDQAAVHLHASLLILLGFLRGRVMFSTSIGQTLSSLCANEIPHRWRVYLPRPLGHVAGVVSAVKLLKSRLISYRTILRSGCLPSTLDPLLLSNPEELFSRLASCFAISSEVERSAVTTEMEVHEMMGFLKCMCIKCIIIISKQ